MPSHDRLRAPFPRTQPCWVSAISLRGRPDYGGYFSGGDTNRNGANRQLLRVSSAGLSNDPNRITSDLQDGARAAIQTGPEQTHTACVLHTGPYWAILDRTGPYWAILGATGPYWNILGHTGLYWTIQEHTGGYWALLGQPGGPPCLRQDTTLHGRPRLGRTHLTSPLHTSPWAPFKWKFNATKAKVGVS